MSSKNKKTINEKIKHSFVRIVKEEGEISERVPVFDAIQQAKSMDLDLVLVGINGDDGVCKICNANQYFYKIEKEKSKKKTPKTKEFNFRSKINNHDKVVTLNKVQNALNKGDNVKISMFLTGKEKLLEVKVEEAKKFLTQVTKDVEPYANIAENRVNDLFIILTKKK